MIRFRDKKEKIGMLLGCVCFIPSFLVFIIICGTKNLLLGAMVLLVTQFLWLKSIELTTSSLEQENLRLENEIAILKEEYERLIDGE